MAAAQEGRACGPAMARRENLQRRMALFRRVSARGEHARERRAGFFLGFCDVDDVDALDTAVTTVQRSGVGIYLGAGSRGWVVWPARHFGNPIVRRQI